MKRLLRNVTVFIAIFLVLNLVPHPFLSPYYGNKWYATKYEHYMKHHRAYNAAIWGSSRMERQVDPRLLDAALHKYGISVFNFGAPGTYNPEEYYLYDKFLDSIEEHPIKYAFLELQPIRDYGEKNKYAMKALYWRNLDFFLFSLSTTLDSGFGLKREAKFIAGHSLSYFARFLYGWKSLYSSNRQERNLLWIGRNEDGFCPLERGEALKRDNDRLRERMEELLDDPSVLEERVSLANQAFSEQHEQIVNEAHLNKLLALINKSREKGIHLVFVIPPRMGLRYEELLALKNNLPERHIVEVANPKKYPELYKLEFSFDRGHLNKKGAEIYTKYLAVELKKHVFNDGATNEQAREYPHDTDGEKQMSNDRERHLTSSSSASDRAKTEAPECP